MSVFDFEFADPEYEASFRAYSNYFADLAGAIGGLYGWEESLIAGVHAGVAAHPPISKIQRRPLDARRRAGLQKALNKSWGHLHRGWRELEDPDDFDAEVNALLPNQAYYAVYHAVRAYAMASHQEARLEHRAMLNLIAKDAATRELLPYPWSVACIGCPHVDDPPQWSGLERPPEDVHVLARPDPDTSSDRLAMFLRTTREQELERRYADERQKNVPRGRMRRNLSRANKKQIGTRLAPTTIFDAFWRLRKKADYVDAEVFVLGAADDSDARRFAESLHIVSDATVAALEVAISAYAGSAVIAEAAEAHARRKRRPSERSPIARRADEWGQRVFMRGIG